MDRRLVAWGRAVKARRRLAVPPASPFADAVHRRAVPPASSFADAVHRRAMPPLWLFTDPARMNDVAAAVRALPAGLCGVVFRHDGVAGRANLLREVARICRARRLMLVVAGPGAMPAGVGRHLREGRGGLAPSGSTSSAHGRAALVRARRAGATLAFLSPVFATASHPGATVLGPCRWAAAAGRSGMAVGALGGVDGRSVRRLPAFVAAVGAIGALLPDDMSHDGHSVS